MLKTIAWRPNTCGCSMVIQRDHEAEPNGNWHIAPAAIRDSDGQRMEALEACPAHAGLTKQGCIEATLGTYPGSEQARYNQVLGEMQTNPAHGLMEDATEVRMVAHPVLGRVPALDAQGGQVFDRAQRFKPHVSCRVTWTGQGKTRVMVATVIGAHLSPGARASLAQFADGKFGPGRIVIQDVRDL